MDCLSKEHFEIVKLLLDHERVDVNQVNNDGWTPLYHACSKGHIEIVNLLIRSWRVNIHLKTTREGKTVIDIANERKRKREIEKYWKEIAELLKSRVGKSFFIFTFQLLSSK